MSEQPLEDRYGAPRPGRRLAWLVGVGVLAIGFVAWVVWAGLGQASPGYGATLRSYQVLSQHQTRVRLDVSGAVGQSFVCTVTAQAEDHAVVGEESVRLTGSATGRTVTMSVKTDRKATTAVVSNCRR